MRAVTHFVLNTTFGPNVAGVSPPRTAASSPHRRGAGALLGHSPTATRALGQSVSSFLCLGIDHERFTYKFQGLNQRLTGVEEAHVVRAILA